MLYNKYQIMIIPIVLYLNMVQFKKVLTEYLIKNFKLDFKKSYIQYDSDI